MYLIDMMKFSKRGCGDMAGIYFPRKRKPGGMTAPSISLCCFIWTCELKRPTGLLRTCVLDRHLYVHEL